MGPTEKLIEEIRQIKVQFKAEVSGGRKQWPRAIKSRVLQLLGSGLRLKKISDETGISYHTVSAWKSQIADQSKFHQLPVIVAASKKAKPQKSATVTVTKKSQGLVKENKSVSVTVTTPDGFVILMGSADEIGRAHV